MLHAPGAYEPVSESPDLARRPFQNDYFQAVVMIHMHMGRADHHVMGMMLNVIQKGREFSLVMIIHDSDRGHHLFLALFPLSLDKMVTHEIPDGFRSGRIASMPDTFVESFYQFRR
jgi:hypothetical protein